MKRHCFTGRVSVAVFIFRARLSVEVSVLCSCLEKLVWCNEPLGESLMEAKVGFDLQIPPRHHELYGKFSF